LRKTSALRRADSIIRLSDRPLRVNFIFASASKYPMLVRQMQSDRQDERKANSRRMRIEN